MSRLAQVNAGEEVYPSIMDERQASRYLHLCTKTLSNLRRRGQLAYFKFGDAIRYDKTDLEKCKQRHRIPTVEGN